MSAEERNRNRAKGWAIALGLSGATYAVVAGIGYGIAFLWGVMF